ncbi:MAG: TIGR04282 family arsenosugar biosynthesis glycosyltransferase [Rhodospirillaceae bacterium]
MRHVVVFARRPKLGTVKTRLAREIGSVETARFYRANLARLAREVGGDSRWATWFAVTPDEAVNDRRVWPGNVGLMPQGDGDLGERMRNCLARFGHHPAVIVGSDVPDLGRRHVDAAFDLLRRNDLVFGPAEDGGYWLVGAAQGVRVGGLFDDVRWSSEDALSDTLENVRRGVKVAMLGTLSDIDTGHAYRAYLARR